MEVITIESVAFKKIVKQLDNITAFIEENRNTIPAIPKYNDSATKYPLFKGLLSALFVCNFAFYLH